VIRPISIRYTLVRRNGRSNEALKTLRDDILPGPETQR